MQRAVVEAGMLRSKVSVLESQLTEEKRHKLKRMISIARHDSGAGSPSEALTRMSSMRPSRTSAGQELLSSPSDTFQRMSSMRYSRISAGEDLIREEDEGKVLGSEGGSEAAPPSPHADYSSASLAGQHSVSLRGGLGPGSGADASVLREEVIEMEERLREAAVREVRMGIRA